MQWEIAKVVWLTAECSDDNALELSFRIGDNAIALGEEGMCIEVLVYLKGLVCEFDVPDAIKSDNVQRSALQVLYKSVPATIEKFDAIRVNDAVRDFIGTIAAVLDPDATAGLHGIDEDAQLRSIGWYGLEQDPVMDSLALSDKVID